MSGGQKAAALFVAGYLLVSAPYAWLSGNGEFIFYILVMVILFGGIVGLHFRIGMPTGLIWCLAVWGLLHMMGGLVGVPEGWPIAGEVRVLYSLWLVEGWLKYDQVVHAFGFGSTAWVCWVGMRSATGVVRPGAGVMVLCAAGAMGFGAANEIVEFAATMTMPETNVGGYVNTGWDLVANAVGAVVAVCMIWWFGGGRGLSDADERDGSES